MSQEIIRHPVPLDMNTLKALKRCSLAGSAKERVLMLYFNTNVGATLFGKVLNVPCHRNSLKRDAVPVPELQRAL